MSTQEAQYDYRKFAILYVDDEAQSLKAFSRAFGDDFRIFTAINAQTDIVDRKGFTKTLGDVIYAQVNRGIGHGVCEEKLAGDMLGPARQCAVILGMNDMRLV